MLVCPALDHPAHRENKNMAAAAMGGRFAHAALAAAFLSGTVAHAQSEPSTEQVRALVESGQSAQAYERFCRTERDFPQRDLWCGIALVDLGRAAEAAIALERYALVNPEDARGRLELARAYYHAGDDVRARAEFEAVQAMKPPAGVQVGINRYLDSLFQRESLYRRRTLIYLEAGVGYDSNVNGGVAQADISLPVLGQVTVLDAGIERSDGFGFAAIGGQINQPVAPGFSVFGSVDAQGTFYQSENDFNLAVLNASAGAGYERGANIFALSVSYGDLRIDSDSYRRSNSVGLEWRHALSPVSSIAVVPQYARLTYTGANDVRDADLAAIAINYRRVWLINWQPALNFGVFYGDEHSRRDRPDLVRSLVGANIEFALSPSPRWALSASAGYTRSEYDAPVPLLAVTREDDYWNAGARAVYFFGGGWSGRLEYTYARNDSNLELFSFDRHTVSAKARLEFK